MSQIEIPAEDLSGELKKETERRRTFAIISHPDAGKTTLTEKLLLYGGAIREAGAVKGGKNSRYAISDWMEIEKQRGISVTSSVMNFDYGDYRINILDTPGHQDFCEDTYRTLTAADSVVMLIDGAKGVEEQTKKLFHVCRMRHIPIFTFVNKMDRYSKPPLDLMEEIESTLGICSCAVNWPIGTDGDFKGVYNRKAGRIELYQAGGHGRKKTDSSALGIDDPETAGIIGEDLRDRLREDISLLDAAGDAFDRDRVLAGELTPMFFGSAMNNFGVEHFLRAFIDMAPSPGPVSHSEGEIDPADGEFSGFVFKIQANMNPAHRDRVAFIRICSGKYEKGMEVLDVRSQKTVRLSQPQQFIAQERKVVEEAYAGDIIGVLDPGIFNIGDTLLGGRSRFRFEGIPMFPAEHFMVISAKDPSKRKQFLKGINQIAEEGAIQVFKQPDIGVETLTIGVAGELQFDVLVYRLLNEYRVELRTQRLPYTMARWVTTDKPNKNIADIYRFSESIVMVEDVYNRPVLLFRDRWALGRAEEKNKDVRFLDIAPPVNI
ncbi:MAG: peptide chain release factor 3 [Eubacteriales bacterium]|nr:peptide chain release factor 3 [Eubacteriales bacterium]